MGRQKKHTKTQTSVGTVMQFWNEHPDNIHLSQMELGSREYFDEVEARKHLVEPHIKQFAQFPRWQGKHILEIGCGIGTDAINFARHGARVTAIDLSETSLELTRRRARIYGLENRIDFYQANAEQLTLTVPPQPYDLIYAFGVIHHTPNPERSIDQIRYYLKPGSVVKIMVYNKYSWRAFSILMNHGKGRPWKMPEFISRYSEATEGCPVTHVFTKRRIRKLLEHHGLTDINIWTDHIFPYRVADFAEYRYIQTLPVRLIPNLLFRWFERRYGWHLCVTARVPQIEIR